MTKKPRVGWESEGWGEEKHREGGENLRKLYWKTNASILRNAKTERRPKYHNIQTIITQLEDPLKHKDLPIPHPHLFDSRFLSERRKLPPPLADQSADKQKLSYLGLCFCLLPRKRGSGVLRWIIMADSPIIWPLWKNRLHRASFRPSSFLAASSGWCFLFSSPLRSCILFKIPATYRPAISTPL